VADSDMVAKLEDDWDGWQMNVRVVESKCKGRDRRDRCRHRTGDQYLAVGYCRRSWWQFGGCL
jgi:hypothetical protein